MDLVAWEERVIDLPREVTVGHEYGSLPRDLRIQLDGGYSVLVGENNSGKSTLLQYLFLETQEVGANDQAVIRRDICPDAGSYVVIEIDWKDGEDPGACVTRLNQELAGRVVGQKQAVHVTVRT